jgi:hypothetical protein
MLYFGYFPLIAIVVIAYNLIAFGGQVFGSGDPNAMDGELAAVLFQIPMVSKEVWKVTIGDMLILGGLITLFQEVLRSSKPDKTAIVNHGLSLGLFVVAMVEFLLIKGFGTSVFFLVMCMTLFDVVAGFTIGIVAARRDIDISGSSDGLTLK